MILKTAYKMKPPVSAKPRKSILKKLRCAGLWVMNENGGLDVYDSSGNGNTGTLIGTSPTFVTGKYGPAVDLPGTDEYILIDNDYLFKDAPFTLIITSRCVEATGYEGFFDIEDDSDKFFMALHHNTYNGLTFRLKHGITDTAYKPAVAIDETQWHTYAFVSSGSAITLYIDGVMVPTVAGLLTNFGGVAGKIRIGNARGIYGDLEVSHIQVCNIALPTSEIAKLYARPFYMFDRPAQNYFHVAGGEPPAITPLFMDLGTWYWTIKKASGLFTRL